MLFQKPEACRNATKNAVQFGNNRVYITQPRIHNSSNVQRQLPCVQYSTNSVMKSDLSARHKVRSMSFCLGPSTSRNTCSVANCIGSVLQANRRYKSPKGLVRPSGLYRRCTRCCAQQGGQGRQYETEFFRKLFGTPPPPKQDSAGGGGGDEPPADGQIVEEEEEPDEEQIQRAKQQARQQALFNFVTVILFVGTLASLSTWEPYFLYLGRVWSFVRVGNQAQAYTELTSEAIAWGLLLNMGWPWNLLIYPTHLTRKELTNARKERRGPIFKNIVSSIYNPFARRKRPPPVAASQ